MGAAFPPHSGDLRAELVSENCSMVKGSRDRKWKSSFRMVLTFLES